MAKTKVITPASEAYEIQKFLKRFSIDYAFMGKGILWAEGDKFFFAQISPSSIKRVIEFDSLEENLFTDTVKSGKKALLDFGDSVYKEMKKALKKDISHFNDMTIYFTSKDGIPCELSFESPESKIFEELNSYKEKLRDSKEEIIPSSSMSPYSLNYYKDDAKFLEVPVKEIYDYEGGDLTLRYVEVESAPEFINCELSHKTEFGKIKIYFIAVINKK